MKQFIAIVVLLMFVGSASGQFTQNSTAIKINPRIDTLDVNITPTFSMPIYNSAYEKYLRKELFKKRNKITFKNTGMQFTQTAYSNWAAGGNNSMSVKAGVDFLHNYTKDKLNIKTALTAAYSMIMDDEKIRKSEDWFNVSVTPDWAFSERWKISASLIVKSQFSNTYKAPDDTVLVSGFMAPGNINLNFGLTYAHPKKDYFSIYLSPVGGSLLTVLNDELAEAKSFGLKEAGVKLQPQLVAFMRIIYNENIYKEKILFNTKMEVEWDYKITPTIWWENKFVFKITNLLSANLNVIFKYNETEKTEHKEEGKDNFWQTWQVNESLGLGLNFNFTSKEPVDNNLDKFVKASAVKKRKKR